jgi:capsular exopolysaccharide synthesis family protein
MSREPINNTQLIQNPAPMPAISGNFPAGPSVAAPGDSSDGSLNVSRYLHALRRRWLLAVVVAVPLSVGATYSVWRLQPGLYTATSILRLAPTESLLLFETAESKMTANSFDTYKRTQRQWMRTRFVILRALRDLELLKIPALREEADPATWIEDNLVVTFPDEAEVVHVSIAADKAEGLHLLVNAIVNAYFEEIVHVERDRKLERINSLELAYRKADSDLRTKRTDLRQLVDRVGTADSGALTQVQQNSLQQFATVQNQYSKVRFELMQARSEVELHEAANTAEDADDSISDHEVMVALRTDPVATQIRADKQRIQDLVESTKARYKSDTAATRIDDHAHRLQGLDARLEARKKVLRGELAEFKRHSAGSGIDALKRKIVLLTTQEGLLGKQVKELEEESKKFGRSSIDVEMMRAEILALQDVLSRLGTELERTRVESQADSKSSSGRVTLMSEAQPARAGDSKKRMAKIAGAGAAAFILPFVLIVWLDARKERINTGSDVEQGLGLSVLGSVPMIPPRVMKRLDGASPREQHWRTLLSESVDSIAAVLLRAAQFGDNRVVMVSSATAGEGKTTLAAHLATSLAIAGHRTALVDFDLRRPALHRVLGLNLKPGVSDVLDDSQLFDASFQATQIPNLMFLSAGRWNNAGLAGLAAADLKTLFDRLRAEYEFVVVDGSPLLPVVDSRLIAQHANSVVISVLRDVSCAPQVRAACQLLDVFGVPILGVVVTGSRGENSYYGPRYERLTDAEAV